MENEREIDQATLDHLNYCLRSAEKQVIVAMERVCKMARWHLRQPSTKNSEDLAEALAALELAHDQRSDAWWLVQEQHELNQMESEAA